MCPVSLKKAQSFGDKDSFSEGKRRGLPLDKNLTSSLSTSPPFPKSPRRSRRQGPRWCATASECRERRRRWCERTDAAWHAAAAAGCAAHDGVLQRAAAAGSRRRRVPVDDQRNGRERAPRTRRWSASWRRSRSAHAAAPPAPVRPARCADVVK